MTSEAASDVRRRWNFPSSPSFLGILLWNNQAPFAGVSRSRVVVFAVLFLYFFCEKKIPVVTASKKTVDRFLATPLEVKVSEKYRINHICLSYFGNFPIPRQIPRFFRLLQKIPEKKFLVSTWETVLSRSGLTM